MNSTILFNTRQHQQHRRIMYQLPFCFSLLLFFFLVNSMPCAAFPVMRKPQPPTSAATAAAAAAAAATAKMYDIAFSTQYQALHPEKLNTNDKRLATGPYLLSTSIDHTTLTKGIQISSSHNTLKSRTGIHEQHPILPTLLHPLTSSSSSNFLSTSTSTHELTPKQLQYAGTIERYFSLYIPTFKCNASQLFCRAFLTTYYNKATGATNVIAGYSIFSVTQSDMLVPTHVLRNVDETEDGEMFHYSMELGSAMIDEKAYRCRLYMFRVAHALRKSIQQMEQCHKLERFSCTRFSFVESC